MDDDEALTILSALAQPTRLKVLTLLARIGVAGMASSDIADAIGIPRHLMSAHLAVLHKAGVVTTKKTGRAVVYFVRPTPVANLGRHLQAMMATIRDVSSPE